MMTNKTRLIDADALIANLRTFKGMGRIVAETLVRFVEKQPTVDAVPVVRCEKCSFGCYFNRENRYGCTHPLNAGGRTRTGTHFCGYGKRKDNG